MLTCEDNALFTRVGPGTPLGQLMRHDWIPVVHSSELAPGGHCKRVKLLGEELVVVQSPAGHVGLLGECCPHRRASLYFGCIMAGSVRSTANVPTCPMSPPPAPSRRKSARWRIPVRSVAAWCGQGRGRGQHEAPEQHADHLQRGALRASRPRGRVRELSPHPSSRPCKV
jgi:Rieske [2Fe-2S] domain